MTPAEIAGLILADDTPGAAQALLSVEHNGTTYLRGSHAVAVLTLDVLGELQVQMLNTYPLGVSDANVMLLAWGKLRRTLQPSDTPTTDRNQ